MNKQNLKKYLYIFVCSLLFIFSLYTFIRSADANYQLIRYPYQIEYREGAVLGITGLFVRNENPFDLKYQPENTYVYGFLYPKLVSVFAKYSGNNLAVHRCVSYTFILLTCILIFLTLLSLRINIAFSLAAAVILHQTFIYKGLIATARPEALGIFFFVLSILIPWKFKFSQWSCIISIILGLLGFFTKPYYAFGIPVLGVYIFLFVSKRRAVIFTLISIAVTSLILFFVSLIYKTFANNTFLVLINSAIYNFPHMTSQVFQYMKVNVILIFLAVMSFTILIIKNRKQRNKDLTQREIFSLVNVFKILEDKPLINIRYDLLFVFVFFSGLLIFILKLGGNLGNGNGAYLYHLASPFLILSAFQPLSKLNDSFLIRIVFALLVLLTLSRQFRLSKYDLSNSESCYKKIEDVIGKSINPLNSPETVSVLVAQNKKVYDSGCSEYFIRGVSDLSLKAGISSGVVNREKEFEMEVNDKIQNKKFDLILQTKGRHSWFVNSDLLNENYICTDTLCASMPFKNWAVETWYPKK